MTISGHENYTHSVNRSGPVINSGKLVMTGSITVEKDGKSRVVKTSRTDADGKKHTEKTYYTKE